MCFSPFIKKDTGDTFPCGKCPPCIARRVSAWSFRLMQQERVSESSQFLTLTYATKHVPITRGGYLNLEKSDIQKFFKRLRKAHGQKTQGIKYYCAGEYGSRTKRPHYHVILFNARRDLIQPAWDKGDIHYGDVTGASIGYSLKYISKPGVVGKKKGDDRQREFSLMSKGLGSNYLTKAMVKWHRSDLKNKMYCQTADNIKIAMPRYYKDKIYSPEQREEIAWHFQQQFRKANEEFNSSPDFDTLMHNRKAGQKAAYELMYHNSTKLEIV